MFLQNPAVAKAHHISHAYSLAYEMEDDTGQSDDRETGTRSDILKNIIQERGFTNMFLSVSRCHHGFESTDGFNTLNNFFFFLSDKILFNVKKNDCFFFIYTRLNFE